MSWVRDLPKGFGTPSSLKEEGRRSIHVQSTMKMSLIVLLASLTAGCILPNRQDQVIPNLQRPHHMPQGQKIDIFVPREDGKLVKQRVVTTSSSVIIIEYVAPDRR